MAEDFANNLKVGDKIKTYSGVYGKIISIKDTPNGKVATIETGEGKNVSYMSVDVYAIYNIETPVQEKEKKINTDEKQPITIAESAQAPTPAVVEETASNEEVKEEEESKSEEETKTEDSATEETTADKPAKKSRTKKAKANESEFEKMKNAENK